MKQNGTAWGELSMRFFSYVQLKQIQTVRTGSLKTVLGISGEQETDLLRRLADSGLIVRLTRGSFLVPPRLPAGGKFSPGTGKILEALFNIKEGLYQVTGPAAFNFYGLDDQVPVYTHVYNNRISGERRIGSLDFRFIKVSDDRLGAVDEVPGEQDTLLRFSSLPRTLLDAVYDWKRFNSLPAAYRWIKEALEKKSELAERIADVTCTYGNQATVRRIGCILEMNSASPATLERLSAGLRSTNTFIPLVPGTHGRGKLDRKWGIIRND